MIDREFLKWWLVGNDDVVDRFIDGFDLEDLKLVKETVTVNGVEKKLIGDPHDNVYFDRFMYRYGKCGICGEIHPEHELKRCTVRLFDADVSRDVCKTCFESGRVRVMCKDGKYCMSISDQPICIDTEEFSLNGIDFRKIKFSAFAIKKQWYNPDIPGKPEDYLYADPDDLLY